ncbi:MAG: 50S ribosomal protein L25 [Chloroflexi bacterium]|nr:50S ribosomal protein L25 [Chloroflexota bacterium]
MADTITLNVTKREVTGKKVRHLRRQGIIPGVLYGPEFEPIQLQVPWTVLRPTLREAGGSQIVELNIDGEKYNALVREVQRAPLRGNVLHIDFYRVRMDVAVTTDVSITLIGDARTIVEGGGTFTHELTAVQVEALPGDLPPEIQVDLTALQEIGDTILVENLPELPGVTYLNNPEDVVVSTAYMRAEEVEEEEEEELLIDESEEPELIRRREEEEELEE